jgi:hypothetical protein
MSDVASAIAALIEEELDGDCPEGVRAVAEAARRRHEGATLAVLFYGSCLRGVDAAEGVVDLYLLVESYRAVHANPLLRLAGALLPPNVYYLEAPHDGGVVRAKYAILTLPHFERLVGPGTLHSYFWARFAQPTRLLWVKDATVRERVAEALAQAVTTTAEAALPLVPEAEPPRTLFTRAFQESYRSELRAERADRAAKLSDSFAARYDRLANLLLADRSRAPDPAAARAAAARWWRRRVLGKVLSVLRLAKAAFTFKDGIVYILWKIERHSGVHQDLEPWQRRHPLLAAPALAWRLYRKGAFR